VDVTELQIVLYDLICTSKEKSDAKKVVLLLLVLLIETPA
jgi:hypothetical protein